MGSAPSRPPDEAARRRSASADEDDDAAAGGGGNGFMILPKGISELGDVATVVSPESTAVAAARMPEHLVQAGLKSRFAAAGRMVATAQRMSAPTLDQDGVQLVAVGETVIWLTLPLHRY